MRIATANCSLVITKSKLVWADFKGVSVFFLIATLLAFGFVASSSAQNTPTDSPQNPAVLKNMGGAGQALSHWLPGSPVPYPELISIDQLEPKDFGLKNKNCYGRKNDRHCTFGDKFEVKLSPGRHTLLVQFEAIGYSNSTIKSAEPLNLVLTAKSGHIYVLEARYIVGGWRAFIADFTDKEHPYAVPVEDEDHPPIITDKAPPPAAPVETEDHHPVVPDKESPPAAPVVADDHHTDVTDKESPPATPVESEDHHPVVTDKESPPAAPIGAEDHHPVFIAQGFQFDQVDALCVMPMKVEVGGKDQVAPGLDSLSPVLMLRVQEKGYRVLDPSCSRDADASAAHGTKPRWVLTVSLINFLTPVAAPYAPMGSVLTASLFDTQSSKEVWRDTARTGWGGRFASNLAGNSVIGAVENDIGPVLAKFEKRKNTPPPTPASMWSSMSFSARLYKVHSFSECNGLIRFDSGTLSFDPSSNGTHDSKCASFQFSVQGAKFGAGEWLIVPGKGKFYLQQPVGTEELYLDLALRSSQ